MNFIFVFQQLDVTSMVFEEGLRSTQSIVCSAKYLSTLICYD